MLCCWHIKYNNIWSMQCTASSFKPSLHCPKTLSIHNTRKRVFGKTITKNNTNNAAAIWHNDLKGPMYTINFYIQLNITFVMTYNFSRTYLFLKSFRFLITSTILGKNSIFIYPINKTTQKFWTFSNSLKNTLAVCNTLSSML